MKLTDEQRMKLRLIFWNMESPPHYHNDKETKKAIDQIEAIVYPESELLKLPREDK